MPNAPKRYSPLGIIDGGQQRRDHTYTSTQRGYGRRWAKAAAVFIAHEVQKDPSCRLCKQIPKHQGKRRPYEVDHIKPPSSEGPPGSQPYQSLFWDENNWQLSCVSCNARKQNKEPK